MKPTLRLITRTDTINPMKSNVLALPLPGNPRSWGVEAQFVPSHIDHVNWLADHLIDNGTSHAKAWALVGWIMAKATDGQDPTAMTTRSEYRKVLDALPQAPWAPRPLGKGTRRTSQAIAREAGRASYRSMMAGGAVLGSPALLAAGAHWGVLPLLYITMNPGDLPDQIDQIAM